MKKKQRGTVFFFCAISLALPLSAGETITLDGRAESTAQGSKPVTATACPDQIQVLSKLNELLSHEKQILQQLADMKQELYAVKVRASRC